MKNSTTLVDNDNKKTEFCKTHFTLSERLFVETFLKGKPKLPLQEAIKELSRLLHKHPKTIKREIERGSVDQTIATTFEHKRIYFATVGDRDSKEKAETKGRKLKIGNNIALADRIDELIVENKYSPFAVVATLNKEGWIGGTKLSEKTIYNYIKSGVFLKATEKHLPCKGKRKIKKIKKFQHKRLMNSMHSIELRPKGVENREEFGNWEGDTIVSGRGAKSCLLTLTERSTRYEITVKLKSKTISSVGDAIDKIERKFGIENFKEIFKSITFDNGSEFADVNRLENSTLKNAKRTNIYYTHPYAASERGTNENHNGIIRRFIKKGANIEKYTNKFVKRIQRWMNNYPRRIFDGKSPTEKLISKKILSNSCLLILLKL